MTTTISQAKHEAGGWRGVVSDSEGKVLTRTINLYPDADKAIAAALRLREHQVQRQLQTDGAA